MSKFYVGEKVKVKDDCGDNSGKEGKISKNLGNGLFEVDFDNTKITFIDSNLISQESKTFIDWDLNTKDFIIKYCTCGGKFTKNDLHHYDFCDLIERDLLERKKNYKEKVGFVYW